ncbi:MAG TPA: hypothetical protein VE714_00950, partial [Gemmatimonadales bacterium]|nr:hypothetical protein [Gemmatimonadales bacterium]
QHCKRGGICRALRANHQIDGRQPAHHIPSENLTQPAAQAIATGSRRLMPRHDEAEPWMTGTIVTPDQIEMSCVPPAPGFPAGRELRAAREAYAARVPLAR